MRRLRQSHSAAAGEWLRHAVRDRGIGREEWQRALPDTLRKPVDTLPKGTRLPLGSIGRTMHPFCQLYGSKSEIRRSPRFSKVSNVRIALITSLEFTHTCGAALGFTSTIKKESLF